jgi:DNA adenine methylase
MEQPETSVRQAFGSPGGKTYLAPRIVGMIPPHEIYVEPFAGGAAVYFKKPPSEKEVLSDKDREIAFAFRFLRDMTPEQFERLKRYDWVKRRGLFDKMKGSKPKNDVERFRRFYYLKKASFGKGGKSFSPMDEGNRIDISRLPKIKERLKRTSIHGGDALAMIRKYDSPTAFFYLDPPYPDRAFIGAKDQYTDEDLTRLVGILSSIKGKFALSLSTEHRKLLPESWHVKRVKVQRRLLQDSVGRENEYEIIATNYNPDMVRHEASYGEARPQFVARRRVSVRRPRARRFRTPSATSLAGIRA